MGVTRLALWRETAGREHTLYRLFDADDNLLYVGISFMPENRLNQHRREKPWWCQVARRELVSYPDRNAAADAERKAIANERPIYNVNRFRHHRDAA
jgi:predicted GIY-YIG superfamily endonuclease